MSCARIAFLSLVVLLLSYFSLGSFFRIQLSGDSSKDTDLKVMTFNTRVFNRNKDFQSEDIPERIIAFVAEQDPDIICFQEFEYYYKDAFTKYPYKHISYEEGRKKVMHAIFSKYPILKTSSLDFPNSSNEGVFSDIVYKSDTLRFYNLHLESFRVRPNAAAISSESSDKLFKRLSKSFGKQQDQADLVREHFETSPYPKVVCGDFNNTQSSYSYQKIKGEMLDSYLEKGNAFGKTFSFFGLPFRIDYVFVEPQIQVTSHKNYNIALSDHSPIVTTLRLSSQ